MILLFLSALGLGVAHALEPDHMAAVSTFVARRPSPREAARFGVNWAIGHGIGLLVFGSLLFALRRVAEEAQPHFFSSGVLEQVVGFVLLMLGVFTLLPMRVGAMHHSHHHPHSHSHDSEYSHPPSQKEKIGSLLMGMLHGTAGTGAFVVQAANAGSARSYAMVLGFTAFFSVGVLLAMALYAALLGCAVHQGGQRTAHLARGARIITGAAACAVGVCLMMKIEIPWIHLA